MAADLRPAIESALENALRPALIAHVDIVPKHNHVDEDALYIVAELASTEERVGGERYLAAMTAVSDALYAIGDSRSSYVRIRYLGEESADEGEADGAAEP